MGWIWILTTPGVSAYSSSLSSSLALSPLFSCCPVSHLLCVCSFLPYVGIVCLSFASCMFVICLPSRSSCWRRSHVATIGGNRRLHGILSDLILHTSIITNVRLVFIHIFHIVILVDCKSPRGKYVIYDIELHKFWFVKFILSICSLVKLNVCHIMNWCKLLHYIFQSTFKTDSILRGLPWRFTVPK